MRAVWSGSISFGLVSVPVKAFSAVEDHDVSFHQVHAEDQGRIRYHKVCEVCGEKVEQEDIAKAYTEGGKTVLITEDDLESLPEAADDDIEVVQFVPTDQVDPIMLERSYFLEPDGKSSKPYVLLRETLGQTDRTAIVTFSMRQKTRLGALRVRDDLLVLQGLLWADEVREMELEAGASRSKVGTQELELSQALVEQFAGDFTPEKFEDEYQAELRALIEEKLKADGKAAPAPASDGDDSDDEGEDAEVIDLMAALKKSLGKSGDAGESAASDEAGSGAGSGSSSGKSSSSSKSGSSSKSSTSKSSSSGGTAKKSSSGTSSSKSSGTSSSKSSGTTKSSTSKSSGTKSSATTKSSGTKKSSSSSTSKTKSA